MANVISLIVLSSFTYILSNTSGDNTVLSLLLSSHCVFVSRKCLFKKQAIIFPLPLAKLKLGTL